jgi:hypothetical protein
MRKTKCRKTSQSVGRVNWTIEIYKEDRVKYGMKLTDEKYSYRKQELDDSEFSDDSEESNSGQLDDDSFGESISKITENDENESNKNKYQRVGYKIGNPTLLLMTFFKNSNDQKLRKMALDFMENFYSDEKFYLGTRAQYLNITKFIEKQKKEYSINTSSDSESETEDEDTHHKHSGQGNFPCRMKGDELKEFLQEIGFEDIPFNEVRDMKAFIELFLCSDDLYVKRS